MVCKNWGIYGFLGPSWVLITAYNICAPGILYALVCNITRVDSNQDLIWCVKIGVYMGFWVHRGF